MKKILEDIQIKFYGAKIEYFHTIPDYSALSFLDYHLKSTLHFVLSEKILCSIKSQNHPLL